MIRRIFCDRDGDDATEISQPIFGMSRLLPFTDFRDQKTLPDFGDQGEDGATQNAMA